MSSDWAPRGYRIDRLLGSGATADVWRARVAATGEPVALKRIHLGEEPGARRDERARRARDEARLLASLEHPNLVRLHDVVHSRDSLVLVLDLADRGSLRDLLTARGRLTPGEVITALAPIAAALGHLHERSVVHGDVSAANVLFTADGAPMLADVGVARLAGEQRAVESTPAYVDPAVAAGAAPSTASDVFMLGAVAFHALTGRPLWRVDGSTLAALARAVGGVPADLANRLTATGSPPALVAAVAGALADPPAARCGAVEFALALRHAGTPVAVEFTAGRPVPSPVPVTDPRPDVETDGCEPGTYPPLPRRRTPATTDPGRPAFARPGPVPAPVGEPPTRMVRPRPRPQIPRGIARRRRCYRPVAAVPLTRSGVPAGTAAARGQRGRHRPTVTGGAAAPGTARSPRWRRVGALLGGAGALVASAALLAANGSGAAGVPIAQTPASAPATTSPASAATSRPATPRRAASASVTGARPATRPPAAPRGAAAWQAVLTRLDAVRADAWATRRPALLSGVYSADLARQDAARLRAAVPAGCGLRGVETDYRALVARATGGGVTMIVLARLHPSRVVCGGQAGAAVPGTASVRLQLRLASTPVGPRIVAERPV